MCYASLAPTKDMEITILGDELTCPAFAGLLHGALRALIDRLGALTFNVGILNISLEQDGAASQQQPVIARCRLVYVVYSKDESTAPTELCPAFLADSAMAFSEETFLQGRLQRFPEQPGIRLWRPGGVWPGIDWSH